MKMAYIAAILLLPVCINYAITQNQSQQPSEFLFYAFFGALWGAAWLHGTWTQLSRLRLNPLWIIPGVLLEIVVGYPMPMPSRVVAWVLGTAFTITQIAFACIPPRSDVSTATPNGTSETP
jgi:hypothetical protein